MNNLKFALAVLFTVSLIFNAPLRAQTGLSSRFSEKIFNFSPKIAKIRAYGHSEISKTKETVELTIAIDLPVISRKDWETIGDIFNHSGPSNEVVNMEDENLQNALCELKTNGENSDVVCDNFRAKCDSYSPGSGFPTDKFLKANLLISGIKLVSETRGISYYYNGKCKLLHAGSPFFRMANCKMEVIGGNDSPKISLYLEIGYETWLYVSISGNYVSFATSDRNLEKASLQKNKKSRFKIAFEEDKDAFLNYYVTKYIFR